MPRSRADRTLGNAWLFMSRLQQKFSAPIFNTQHLLIDMGSCQLYFFLVILSCLSLFVCVLWSCCDDVIWWLCLHLWFSVWCTEFACIVSLILWLWVNITILVPSLCILCSLLMNIHPLNSTYVRVRVFVCEFRVITVMSTHSVMLVVVDGGLLCLLTTGNVLLWDLLHQWEASDVVCTSSSVIIACQRNSSWHSSVTAATVWWVWNRLY